MNIIFIVNSYERKKKKRNKNIVKDFNNSSDIYILARMFHVILALVPSHTVFNLSIIVA